MIPKLFSTAGDIYTDEEDRYKLLSQLSIRLNANYNDARNPGSNNSSFNPKGLAIPEGDISTQELFKAAVERNSFNGGVCNDISEVVAQVGEHLFPDKDVLVLNGGSHFGVLVSDGKTNRIINVFETTISTGGLDLDKGQAATNLRINKVIDGKLTQIAVVDTQVGQLVEGAFDKNRKLLKTDVDISKVLVEFIIEKT